MVASNQWGSGTNHSSTLRFIGFWRQTEDFYLNREIHRLKPFCAVQHPKGYKNLSVGKKENAELAQIE